MTEVLYNPKIKPEHLARKAIVYLRQSSDKQVRQNKESQLLQYAVAERVRALGWQQVEIINSDLGSSAGLGAAKKAFEQYDAVDARNRLAACELERRWNEKLEEIEAVKQRLSSLESTRCSLSPEEEIRIRSMGDHFAGVWQGNHCPPTLKKMIFRTAIEEIIVRTDQDKKTLDLVIHWKGGAHTQLAVERPRSATETATPIEALEIIRRMAVRYGDDQIASVLNRRGYSTGKGKRWNQTRVATARRNHSIAGQKRALPDPERVGLSEAARICAVSHHTIQRLVEAGLLKREQVTPRAPWEIRRSDLDAEPILSIVGRLRRTGKLVLQGGCAEDQLALFIENQGDDND